MPILFIHGVAIRDDAYWIPLERLLRTYVAPQISPEPQGVSVDCLYWGDLGARMAYSGASTPEASLARLGKAVPQKAREVGRTALSVRDAALSGVGQTRRKVEARYTSAKTKVGDRIALARGRISGFAGRFKRLKDLELDAVADVTVDLLAQAISESPADEEEKKLALEACDEVAFEPETAKLLAECADSQSEAQLLVRLVNKRYQKLKELRGLVGGKRSKPVFFKNFPDRMLEALERYSDFPGYLVTRAAAEAKGPMNAFVASFLGDVFTYMRGRGDYREPGAIPLRVLDTLAITRAKSQERGGEPIVVLTHSMGGQIFYDVITHFVPKIETFKDIRIDFWCATASQVGFFEELKLFLESDEKYCKDSGLRVPGPDPEHLGFWWNVWDHNDFVSWSADAIFDRVDDEGFATGMPAVEAHGGYLIRPSFFRRLAGKIAQASASGFR